MKEEDIPAVVELHTRYIPGALFPRLGREFMFSLYRAMLSLDSAATFVYETEEEGEKPAAFITVTTDSSLLFRQVLKREFFPVLWRVFLYVLGNPLRIGEVLETAAYSGKEDVPGVTAELLFIAMEKECRKKELSDALVKECLQWLKEKGIFKVKVAAFADNRGPNALLQRLGFKLAVQTPFRGRTNNIYLYENIS